MTTPTKVLIDPKGVVPTFYKMFYRRVHCKHCGVTHSYDQVYAMIAVAGGYRGIPLNSMAEIEYNLPVKVETTEVEGTPFCHMCFNPDILKHLPKADAAKQRPIVPSWAGTGVRPAARPTKKPAAKTPKGPKTYTVDDLDID